MYILSAFSRTGPNNHSLPQRIINCREALANFTREGTLSTTIVQMTAGPRHACFVGCMSCNDWPAISVPGGVSRNKEDNLKGTKQFCDREIRHYPILIRLSRHRPCVLVGPITNCQPCLHTLGRPAGVQDQAWYVSVRARRIRLQTLA